MRLCRDEWVSKRGGAFFEIFSNNGGAVFRGIEAEGTVALTHGVAIYANATANDAYYNGSGFPVVTGWESLNDSSQS